MNNIKYDIIEYRMYFDFPRMFLVKANDRTLYFLCKMDEFDEHYDYFDVYLMPDTLLSDIPDDWTCLENDSDKYLGQIKISDMMFDSTRKKYIEINSSNILAY